MAQKRKYELRKYVRLKNFRIHRFAEKYYQTRLCVGYKIAPLPSATWSTRVQRLRTRQRNAPVQAFVIVSQFRKVFG